MAIKVLVVDDEADTLNLLEVKFKKAGYDMLTAANGNEGVEKSHRRKRNLVWSKTCLLMVKPDSSWHRVVT